ncbi:MAG: hypothetical protein OXI81_04535 [Paracoccaceae bacterium]|nr:hypothetical protein [Paracoccaceae bacterium]MDE2913290.1 hypothetical protein [Paracoccaceae bacterium]
MSVGPSPTTHTPDAITFGFPMSRADAELPEWDRVLTAAAHLQELLPDAVLAGGTASAIYADHRLSHDADHIRIDLHDRFDNMLLQRESAAGWTTARDRRPDFIPEVPERK